MHLVAVAELTTPTDRESAELARDLGAAPYDVRLALSGGLPAIVLATPDDARATDLLQRIRSRGQGAIACAVDDIVPNEGMVNMRRFVLEPNAILAEGASLPHDDVLCLLRATQRTSVTTTEEVKDRKIAVGKALMTGGLMATKSVKKEVTNVAEKREQVLYVFRKSGQTPWLLEESRTHYQTLGADLAPTTPANFATTIRKLRASAPRATYDERLLRPVRAAKLSTAATDVDVAAHLLAAWFAELERRKPPFRS